MTAAIVIPCWNAERWIGRAIQSALDQDIAGIEVIVVDDGSSDGSLDVVRSFGERIRWLSTSNRGACAARNAGMALAAAEYVCFLDADDYLLPHHVRDLAAATGGTADLAIAQTRLVVLEGQLQTRILPYRPGDTPADFVRHWLNGDSAQTSSLLWRRAFLAAIGGWNEQTRRLQDIELGIRAFLSNAAIRVCPSGGAPYVKHGGVGCVSLQHERGILEGDLKLTTALDGQLACYPADVRYALGFFCYRLAGIAYCHGADDIGDAQLRLARANGMNRHIGSFAHRFVATLVGYPRKVRISRWIKAAHQRLMSVRTNARLGPIQTK